MKGKMQGLPVSGPLTVWQLELGWSKVRAASLLTRDPDSRDGVVEAADVPWRATSTQNSGAGTTSLVVMLHSSMLALTWPISLI